MNCAQLRDSVMREPLHGWGCVAAGDYLRLQTPLRYPDGGYIEVFVETYGNDLVVTDFGEASRFLETHGIDPTRGATRRRLIELAIELGGATSSDGTIEIRAQSPDKIFEAALRLAQIITRIGDLTLGSRGALGATFSEEVEDFLRSRVPASEIQSGAEIIGKEAPHRVDLLARLGDARPAAIEALAATSTNSANSQMAWTVAKFADIARVGPEAPSLVTIIDDSSEVWKPSLRNQLAAFSTVLDWDQREELVRIIREPERANLA